MLRKLRRTSTLKHKGTGVSLQTPLLVPSFSSKGFKPSEISTILESSSEFITDAYLISAYDIANGHLPEPRNLPFKPELLFLDSGGYEISKDQDLSAVEVGRPGRKKWDVKKLTQVLNNWPNEIATVFVSYDHPREHKSFAKQLTAARKLFQGRPHLYTFIIKPQSKDEVTLDTTLREAMAQADELQAFDIIGVTEKELGRSVLERMVKLAKLRQAMDDAHVTAPIHVFGALDPLTACLYFIAGAEIFDGLTWIRYSYDNRGCCVYTSNHGAMNFGLDVTENEIKTRAMAANVHLLRQLQRKLREFDTTNDFGKLAPHSDLLRNASDTLETALQKGEF